MAKRSDDEFAKTVLENVRVGATIQLVTDMFSDGEKLDQETLKNIVKYLGDELEYVVVTGTVAGLDGKPIHIEEAFGTTFKDETFMKAISLQRRLLPNQAHYKCLDVRHRVVTREEYEQHAFDSRMQHAMRNYLGRPRNPSEMVTHKLLKSLGSDICQSHTAELANGRGFAALQNDYELTPEMVRALWGDMLFTVEWVSRFDGDEVTSTRYGTVSGKFSYSSVLANQEDVPEEILAKFKDDGLIGNGVFELKDAPALIVDITTDPNNPGFAAFLSTPVILNEKAPVRVIGGKPDYTYLVAGALNCENDGERVLADLTEEEFREKVEALRGVTGFRDDLLITM